MKTTAAILTAVIGEQPSEIMNWLCDCTLLSASIGEDIAESSPVAKIPACGAFNRLVDKLIAKIQKDAPAPEKTIIPDRQDKKERGEQLSLF